MQKLRPRTKAFMIVDHEMERSTLWCLCGRLYVFNGIYNNVPSTIASQVSCSCYGEGLQNFNQVKVVNIQANSFTNAHNSAPVDNVNAIQMVQAPYSVSRKTSTIYYTYSRVSRRLEEAAITSGITVKAVPGQTPRVLKWVRGNDKEDIKTVTYMGGAALLSPDFVGQAWIYLRPDTTDQTYTVRPANGVDLMYFLALPSLAKTGELSAMAGRLSRRGSALCGAAVHLNPDAHLLHTLVTKADVINHKSPDDFLTLIIGVPSGYGVSVDALNSGISWPTMHFMAYVLRDNPNGLGLAIREDGIYWSFYDAMLCDRVMSNYMDDLWALFKWLKTKMSVIEIGSMVRCMAGPQIARASHHLEANVRATVSRKIIDALATYRKLSNQGLSFLANPSVTFGTDGAENWAQVERLLLEAYRLSNEGEVSNAGQGPGAPISRGRGRISSRSVSRSARRRPG